MQKIYLDNAATSFPKPEAVARAVYDYIVKEGVNINRSSYSKAYDAEVKVYECRRLLCELFNGPGVKNVIFTGGITESLNVSIMGLLKKGDHVLVSSLEHNSVMRPVKNRVDYDVIPCDENGDMCLDTVKSLIRPDTKAIIATHASNVCGTINPLYELGKIAKEHGLYFIVDSAQSGGVLEIDMEAMNIDVLCFAGHKGLLGPQGIGGFVINNKAADIMEPFIYGGTGSVSDSLRMPEFLPDKYEAGTLNVPGIIGLAEGVRCVLNREIQEILRRELKATATLLEGFDDLQKEGRLKIIGHNTIDNRVGVVSVTCNDISKVSYLLDDKYDIMTRVGLHCSPLAHKSLGTFPEGTLRFSVGVYTTMLEIERCIEAMKQLLK